MIPQGACMREKHSVVEEHQSVKNKWFYGEIKKKINFTKVRLEKIQVIEHLEGWDSVILKMLPSASFVSDPDGVANVFQFLAKSGA